MPCLLECVVPVSLTEKFGWDPNDFTGPLIDTRVVACSAQIGTVRYRAGNRKLSMFVVRGLLLSETVDMVCNSNSSTVHAGGIMEVLYRYEYRTARQRFEVEYSCLRRLVPPIVAPLSLLCSRSSSARALLCLSTVSYRTKCTPVRVRMDIVRYGLISKEPNQIFASIL